MRRPPIKINKQWIAEEIMKAGALVEFIPDVQLNANQDYHLNLLIQLVQCDRIRMTDAAFRHKYINYIRRVAP